MKKFNPIIVLLTGLLLPLSAIASPDEEVTIRVMGINESSTDSVMKMIELPDLNRDRNRQQSRQSESGPGDNNMPGLQERERLQKQARESEQTLQHEMQMEQLQETQQQQQELELDRDLDTGRPGSPQNGGGPAG